MNDGGTKSAALSRLAREGRKMASFGAIGAVNGVVNYVVTLGIALFVLTPLALEADAVALGVAKACGWAVAVTNSYVLNALTTFADESGGRLSWPAYGRFAASGTVGLLAEVGSFVVAAAYLPLAIASIVPILASFLVNFTMTRLFVFPGGK